MYSCSAFHSKIDHFRSTARYCDVKILIQDRYFSCHRVILASASEYFDTLFGSNFREKDAQEVVLHDIDAGAFEEILCYIYTGHEHECKVNVSNVFNLLSCSLFLRIHAIEVKCVKYVSKNITSIQDHARLFALAHSMNITPLINVLSKYIINNLKLFYNRKDLLELSFDDLKIIINRWSLPGELVYKCETLMFHLILRWMRFLPDERRKYLIELINVIDFSKISSDYIALILQHFGNSAHQSDCGTRSVLGKRASSSDLPSDRKMNTLETSKNLLLFKRKISEYLSMDSGTEIPDSFHSSSFYKNITGLFLYVEYVIGYKKVKEAEILSFNLHYPEWFVFGKTDTWYSCDQKWITQNESNNLLYSMEIFNINGCRPQDSRQIFCAYTSVDMKSPLRVLTSPPIYLENEPINMLATPKGIIYLLDSQSNRCPRSMVNGLLSKEEIERGIYSYNCNIDCWFSVPPMETRQSYPCLSADDDLLYAIGGWTDSIRSISLFQAYDYRSGKWMRLPNFSEGMGIFDCSTGQSCTLGKNVFVLNKSCMGSFDTIARKWEKINIPVEHDRCCGCTTKMLVYNNSIVWPMHNTHEPSKIIGDDKIAAYRPCSRDWHISESLGNAISGSKQCGKGTGCFWDVRDIITFST